MREGRDNHLRHRPKKNRQGKEKRHFKTTGKIDPFRVRPFFFKRNLKRFKGHATNGATSVTCLSDFRMHGTGEKSALIRRLIFNRLNGLWIFIDKFGGIFFKPVQTVGRAKMIGFLRMLQATCRTLRHDIHATNRVKKCRLSFRF